MATLIAGDFFGEQALLYGIKRTATCRTVTPCIVYILKRKNYELLKRQYPFLEDEIIALGRKRSKTK